MGGPQARVDFFISYTAADRPWAEWIAWQLEVAGFTTLLQAWDFRPGTDFARWACTVARFTVLKRLREQARDRLVFDDEALERFTETGANSGGLGIFEAKYLIRLMQANAKMFDKYGA